MRDHHGAGSADGIETAKQLAVSILLGTQLLTLVLTLAKLWRFQGARSAMGIPSFGHASS
jgi:hypothetical protein